MGYNVHDVSRKVVTYYKRKPKINKMNFQLWLKKIIICKNVTQNLQGIHTFSKIHIYSQKNHIFDQKKDSNK